MSEYKYHFETLQLHVGQEEPDPATDSRAVPIYQTTSYVFKNSDHAQARFGLADAGNIYGRLTNSTQDVFEQRVAALTQAGDHIVSAKTIYGGTYNYLEHTFSQFGVTTTFVDPDDLANFENAIQDNTKAIFIETLGNPNSNLVDIQKLADIAHSHNIPLVIDSTFATPYLLRPIEYGADIVVHSATKFIGGHGTTLGGVIVDSGNFDWKASGKYPQISDPNPSYHGISFQEAVGPAEFVTYILQGLETLSLRVERHVENTKKVIEYLVNNPKVEKVNHPSIDPRYKELYNKYFPNGAGSIFTFEIKGGEAEAKKFIDSLKIFSILANVADVKSLVIHPATKKSLQSRALSQIQSDFLSVQSILTILFTISTKLSPQSTNFKF